MKKLFIGLLAVAALFSCSRNEIAPVAQDSDVVRFSTNLQTFTVKTDALEGKSVRVFAGAPINASTLATASAGSLTQETPLRWEKGQTQFTSFASIYPAEIAQEPSFEYDLMYEGSQNFDYHVEVLTATAKNAEPGKTVALTYSHPFAMLQITVTNELDLPEETPAAEMKVSGVVAKAAFDLLAGTVQLADETAIIPATLQDGVYKVLIMPQTAAPVLAVKLADKVYKFSVKEDIEFKAGKRYSSTIAITEGSVAEMDYDVEDWDDEDPIDFDPVTTAWKVVGLGGNWNYADGVAMTRDAEGKWEADITYAEGDSFKLCNGEGEEAVWAGMKNFWEYYGTGEYDDAYLDASESAINVVLQEAGKYHLLFDWPSCRFIVTKTGDIEPVDPEEPAAWKVLGIGGEWDYEDGIAMTEAEGVWECDITYAATDAFKLFDGTTWMGMKSDWSYYGLGDFADGILYAGDAGKDIVIGEGGVAGNYHLAFTPATGKLVITDNGGTEPVDPEEPAAWKVLGIGGEWDYEDGIAMTEAEGVWECDITYAATDAFKLFDGTTWMGMKSDWSYYGLGDFADGILYAGDAGKNIVIGEGGVAGSYHLAFTPATGKFIITAIEAGE